SASQPTSQEPSGSTSFGGLGDRAGYSQTPGALARSRLKAVPLDATMSGARDQMLFELEQKLAQAGGRLSAGEASALIAEDFVEFGASGKVWTKAEILAAMPGWSPRKRIVENFR